MTTYTAAYNSSGAYVRVISSTESPDASLAPPTPPTVLLTGEVGVDTSTTPIDPYTQYHTGTGVTTRPTLTGISWNKTSITANGTDSATLSGLPNPSTVLIQPVVGQPFVGQSALTPYTVTDGFVTFKTDHKDQYRVRVEVWPKQAYEQVITAT